MEQEGITQMRSRVAVNDANLQLRGNQKDHKVKVLQQLVSTCHEGEDMLNLLGTSLNDIMGQIHEFGALDDVMAEVEGRKRESPFNMSSKSPSQEVQKRYSMNSRNSQERPSPVQQDIRQEMRRESFVPIKRVLSEDNSNRFEKREMPTQKRVFEDDLVRYDVGRQYQPQMRKSTPPSTPLVKNTQSIVQTPFVSITNKTQTQSSHQTHHYTQSTKQMTGKSFMNPQQPQYFPVIEPTKKTPPSQTPFTSNSLSNIQSNHSKKQSPSRTTQSSKSGHHLNSNGSKRESPGTRKYIPSFSISRK